jgi:mediator of replication checkpoint protein 1
MAMLNNSDEDSDEDIRPRGKLASRMQGAAVSATATTKPIVVQESPNEQHRTKIPASNTEDGNTADTESDNDTLPVAPRRLKRKLVAVQPDAASEPAARSPSPGLFVSSPAGPSPAKSIAINKDAEPELPAMKTDRFKALVERKKQERLAREAAEEARKAERRAQQEKIFSELDTNDSNVSDITDDEGGRRLTQDARPTRKASKKAIEEMTRETQRMARSMQLAHEAKTKKKISKNSLFERFNFKPVRGPEPKTTSSSRPSTPHSDVDMKDAETPPSSPPAADKLEKAEAAVTESAIQDNQVQHSDAPLDKGKGKAIAVPNHSGKPEVATKRHVRVILPDSAAFPITIDSDDELQITTTAKDRINAVFDRVPAKRSEGLSSLKALRVLAQVRSPGKQSRRKDDQSGMSISALQASLQQKARQQAKFERERRLNMLKAQGIVIQTAEEREREMEEVEDLVARAREEAQHIMAQEREDAKKNKGDNENDPLAWDDSEDDDYDERGEDADAEVSDVELSGSEEEADAEEEEEADGNPLFDASASEGESEAAEEAVSTMDKVEESDDEMGEIEELPTRRRPRRQAAIVSDDDEAAVEATPRSETLIQATPNPKSKAHATPKAPSTISPAPGSVLRSARKTFIPGLPVAGPAGLGLTQIFAGTMDDSQMSTGQAPTQSMMPDFDNFPDSNFSATMDEIPGSIGPDSLQDETQNATQGVRLNLSQSQMRGLESLQYGANTQLSDILELEPSQDGGLQEYTPLKERFVEPPHSTVDTVIVGHEDVPQDSPLVRRGRLRRKVDTAASEAEVAIPSTNPEPTVFNVMKEGAKKEQKKQLIDEFNRKKSKAKEMIEEQAEESEDEYQGLGGYDGEDSDDDSTTSVKDMIDDDATASTMDEAKLAAFYAYVSAPPLTNIKANQFI